MWAAVAPLSLPEYPLDAEQEQQFFAQQPDAWLQTQSLPVQKDEDDEDLFGLIGNTLGSPKAQQDDDDELLAMLDHVLAMHAKKEEHEWFDKLMRQKGIVLPR